MGHWPVTHQTKVRRAPFSPRQTFPYRWRQLGTPQHQPGGSKRIVQAIMCHAMRTNLKVSSLRLKPKIKNTN